MLALVLSALAIMGSPGPATISLTAAGSAYGVRRSLRYLVGIVAGTEIVLLLVATGVTSLLLALPGLRPALLAVSAAYVLWLAWHIATAPPAEDAAAPAPTLAGGMLLGAANPKAWIAIAAVFATGHVAHGAVADAAAKTGVLTVLIVAINGGWLLTGIGLAPLLRSRAANVTLALLLVAATTAAIVR